MFTVLLDINHGLHMEDFALPQKQEAHKKVNIFHWPINVRDYLRTLALCFMCVSVSAGNASLRITLENQSCVSSELYIRHLCFKHLV